MRCVYTMYTALTYNPDGNEYADRRFVFFFPELDQPNVVCMVDVTWKWLNRMTRYWYTALGLEHTTTTEHIC